VLVQSHYALREMSAVRRVIRENGFATLVTHGANGLIASHLPVLLDPEHDPGDDAEELVLIGHTARADPQSHDLENGIEALSIFQGPHGYISPLWYGTGPVRSNMEAGQRDPGARAPRRLLPPSPSR